MNIKSFSAKTLLSLIILVAGVSVGSIGVASASNLLNRSYAAAPKYEKNASGETFGSLMIATAVGTEPDLVKAIGVDGTIGYIRSSDLNLPEPKTPEEAVAQNAIASKSREIPLYKADGKTVIGKFRIDPAIVSSN